MSRFAAGARTRGVHMPRSARPVRHDGFGYRWSVGLLAAVALLISGAAVISASSAGAATTRNLVRDPSFRYGANAWTVTRGTHVWATSYGHAGHRSLGVRNLYSYPRNSALNDRRNTVARTTAGRTYAAS